MKEGNIATVIEEEDGVCTVASCSGTSFHFETITLAPAQLNVVEDKALVMAERATTTSALELAVSALKEIGRAHF